MFQAEHSAGYGAAAAETTVLGRSRDAYKHAGVGYRYSQMLQMAMEAEAGEGTETPIAGCVQGGCRSYLREAAAEVEEEEDADGEGFAENDYDLTFLRLGVGGGAPPCESGAFNETAPSRAGGLSSASRCSSGFTRLCSMCGTSKTPLWRSGPMGAKSLCNACGIRSNKAKKQAAAIAVSYGAAARKASPLKTHPAMAAAEAAEGPLASKPAIAKRKITSPAHACPLQQAKKQRKPPLPLRAGACSPAKTETSSSVTSPGTPSPYPSQKKRWSYSSASSPRPAMDQPFFSGDEEQAAFLLMALSCGLVLAN